MPGRGINVIQLLIEEKYFQLCSTVIFQSNFIGGIVVEKYGEILPRRVVF